MLALFLTAFTLIVVSHSLRRFLPGFQQMIARVQTRSHGTLPHPRQRSTSTKLTRRLLSFTIAGR